MKTIKIIDLLNRIAKGENVPKKIIYKGDILLFVGNAYMRKYIIDGTFFRLQFYEFKQTSLNDEAEIVEIEEKSETNENEDNYIEEIETCYDEDLEENIATTFINGRYVKQAYGSPFEQMLIDKINEIIKKYKELIK